MCLASLRSSLVTPTERIEGKILPRDEALLNPVPPLVKAGQEVLPIDPRVKIFTDQKAKDSATRINELQKRPIKLTELDQPSIIMRPLTLKEEHQSE